MTAFAIVLLGWVFSLCLHEFSHAIVAYWGGDRSVKEKGYLTFNPLRYTHPLLSLGLPVLIVMMGGIGLPGGAVYIDRTRLRSRDWESAVSMAGPAANLGVAGALAIPFAIGVVPALPSGDFWPAVAFLVILQLSSVVLNLLPIPGMDGFGIIAPWLPQNVRLATERLGFMPMLVLFMVLWYVEPVNAFFWKGVWGLSDLIGVPPWMGNQGYRAFRFWDR